MISERILDISTGILIFIMFGCIGLGLAKQFDPANIKSHSPYTSEYVERLEREKSYYKQQANYYERSYDDITRILEK